MKNITAQYRDLLEGKISKANFMTNVRRLFPDYVGTSNSLEDTVTILKGKRILSEGIHDRDITSSYGMAGHVNPKSNDDAYARMVSKPIVKGIAKKMSDYEFEKMLQDFGYEEFWSGDVDATIESMPLDALRDISYEYFGPGKTFEIQDLDKTTSQLDAEGNKKAFYLVDETGDIIDSVMAVDSQEASDYFETEYEGIGSSLTVLHTSSPDELKGGVAEDLDMSSEETTSLGEAMDADLEAAKEEARKNSEEGYVQHVNKKEHGYTVEDWYDADSTVASYENGDQINEAKKSLNEAEEKSEGSYKKVTGKEQYSVFNEIDRVNPYELRKGITIEMGMQYLPTPNYFTTHFNPDTLAKATKKVLKNLQKDPAFYTNQISMETEKRTNMYQKPKELKVGADGEAKVKGFTDAKSNTETNLGKKEKGTKSPEGVKEMKPSKKSMGGIKIMKTNEKLPKGVELMKEGVEVEAKIKSDKIAKLKEYLKAEVRKILKEEDPALTKLEKDEETAEKALATVLTKKAAILNKPGTQG